MKRAKYVLNFFIMSASSLAYSADEVCFYDDVNYQGDHFCTNQENSWLGETGWNDRISSIKVSGTAYVEGYSDRDYADGSLIFMTDVAKLKTLNNGISSIKIKHRNSEDFICLYDDTRFRGSTICAERGSSLADLGQLKNRSSSIKLFGNVKAEVFDYENFNQTKAHFVFNRSWQDLRAKDKNGHNWNDDIDSLIVSGNDISTCPAPWQGPHCDQIDLRSVNREQGLNDLNGGHSYWGGSPIQGDDGRYHLFVSRMKNSCGLSTWLRNSECVRASSGSPLGPFSAEETVMGAFCHNPTVKRLSDGTFLMYYIGKGDQKISLYDNCSDGKTFGDAYQLQQQACDINVRAAKSIYGPWTAPHDVLHSGLKAGICPTNPSPIVQEDDSILMVYRNYDLGSTIVDSISDLSAHTPEKIFTAKADKWNGDYNLISIGKVLDQEAEDTFVWKDKREGLFHMIYNNKFDDGFNTGGHAISYDAKFWTQQEPIFSRKVEFTDGLTETLVRRERPQIIWLSDEKGVLYSGVQPTWAMGDKIYTMAAAIGDTPENIDLNFSAKNYVSVRSKKNGMCLGISGDSVKKGANVELQYCNGGGKQGWYYDIESKLIHNQYHYDRCIDLSGGNTNNSGNIQIWECSSENKNMQWDINSDGSIRSAHSNNKVIDASGMSSRSNIYIWSDWGGANQRWSFIENTVGRSVIANYYYEPEYEKTCPYNGATFDGANCLLFRKNVNAHYWWLDGKYYYSKIDAGEPCPYNDASFDGANCVVFQPINGVNHWWFRDGLYYSPIEKPVCNHHGASFDGANCLVMPKYSGLNYWTYQGGYYYSSLEGECKYNNAWFDGSNCKIHNQQPSLKYFTL